MAEIDINANPNEFVYVNGEKTNMRPEDFYHYQTDIDFTFKIFFNPITWLRFIIFWNPLMGYGIRIGMVLIKVDVFKLYRPKN